MKNYTNFAAVLLALFFLISCTSPAVSPPNVVLNPTLAPTATLGPPTAVPTSTLAPTSTTAPTVTLVLTSKPTATTDWRTNSHRSTYACKYTNAHTDCSPNQ